MASLPFYMRCLQAIPQRRIMAIMNFLALLSVSTMSGCLSLTITQMVKPIVVNITAIAGDHSQLGDLTCPMPIKNAWNSSLTIDDIDYSARYDWSEELQGIILGSYYIGYVIMHLPGALLAERIGGKVVMIIGLGCTVILTLLTPICVSYGDAYALITIRALIGTFQGGMWPAVSTLLAAWVPSSERGLLASLVFCGLPCGAIFGNLISGLLLDSHNNWHVVFYVFGSSGLIVTLLFMLLCTSNPSTHPFITDEEKRYLQKEMGQLERAKDLPATPWKAMLSSRPVIALMVDMVLGDWAYFVLMIDLPKYMNDVLHVSVKENGFYSSMPWVMRILVSFTSGYWADWLIRSERLSITNTRKLFVCLAATIDGSFLLAASYAGCDAKLVAAFFIISVGAEGFLGSSTLANPMDLSPNFAGTITGFTNGIGSIAGILVPWVIGILTPNSLQSEWRVVFWISFGVHMVKMVNFTLFGSGKVQPWNAPQRPEHELAVKNEVAGFEKRSPNTATKTFPTKY